MALIRATCKTCGDIELTSRDITIRLCIDTHTGTYVFRCPVCQLVEVKNADDQVVDILVAAGVKLQAWKLPAELDEHPNKDVPALTHDDAITFHKIMEREDWFERLLEVGS